jgi:hypothetical protein
MITEKKDAEKLFSMLPDGAKKAIAKRDKESD